jgi:hypothetical protein
MKKLVFLPLVLACFILVSHTRESMKEKDMSFTAFLKLFPKEDLPYKISLKQMIKNGKKKPEIHQDSTEQANINPIFAKYLPNSDKGNGIGERGYYANVPVAQIAFKDYYLVFYSRNFLGYSFQSSFYMSVLDKNGQHILTDIVASPGFNGWRETSIDRKGVMTTKIYEALDEKKTNFALKQTAKTSLMDLIYKTQPAQASR